MDAAAGDEAVRLPEACEITREQRELLESIAAGEPLHAYLERIVRLIEGVTPDAVASILLLDRDGVHIRHGAAPHLPESFIQAIDGSEIGPCEGSCGAAAHRGERVIVEDIATHPNWRAYKQLALPAGLRACWSSPIFSPAGEVLGTFAIYYRRPRVPSQAEIDTVDVATHLAAVAIGRDRAEQDVRASEQSYRQIYETIVDVIFHVRLDAEGEFRFTSVNTAFTHATGLEPEQVVGKRVRDVIPPESVDQVLSAYQRAMDIRDTVRWFETSRYPTGVKHGDVAVTPIVEADGSCRALVGTVHDVTERHLANVKIAEQAALLDHARDAILLVGPQGEVRYWNAGAVQLYGISKEEAVGRALNDLVPSDDDWAQRQQQLRRTGESRVEIVRRTAHGTQRTIESRATLLRDEHSSESRACLVIETDVTERRALEASVQRAQRLESLGTMASGIAHDFNNVLASIMAYSQLARAAKGNAAKLEECLEGIEQASELASKLTDRVLAFGSGQRTVERVDLRRSVSEAVGLLRPRTGSSIELELSLPDEPMQARVDVTAVHQAVINLVTNAVQAIGDRAGHIRVALEASRVPSPRAATVGVLERGDYVQLSVTDDGPGVEPQIVGHMFEPYVTTKDPGEGTGLGLWVVHGIVMSHDGALDVCSESGGGTRMAIYLPAG